MPGDMERNRHAATILNGWADAIRGDWSSIDGRSCREQLWEITRYLTGGQDALTFEDVGICVKGKYGGHWFGNSYDHNCEEANADATDN